ncbi:MAG TPA: UrcA family protein [Steroidobacteraceae bacterium]|nr:UrcA family protein [Steroidobacteraceae bacterium]
MITLHSLSVDRRDQAPKTSAIHLHLEIHMYTKRSVAIAPALVGVIACFLNSGAAAAAEHTVSISKKISSEGLDLSRPADAQTFLTRLEGAAWMLCKRGTRVDLKPVDNFKECYEKTLGDAVRTTNKVSVTQAYLLKHTLQDAASHGIELPAQLAAK